MTQGLRTLTTENSPRTRSVLERVVLGFACLLVVRVVFKIVGSYPQYFPPDFGSEFLLGRDTEFFGPYQWAFTIHVTSGPFALLAGLLLLSADFRQWRPRWHRALGRTQCVLLLTCVAPSGFWMAFYAHSGRLAEFGFVTLAFATFATASLGWRSVVNRNFRAHQRWMTRNFLLLFSAVVLRIIGGASVYFGCTTEWIYPVNAWVSWLLPIGLYELLCYKSSISPKGSRGEDRSAIPSRK